MLVKNLADASLKSPLLTGFYFFSLFILLRGRSRDEAFDIGREIVDAVTADNPKPVKLKFEKVCIPKF